MKIAEKEGKTDLHSASVQMSAKDSPSYFAALQKGFINLGHLYRDYDYNGGPYDDGTSYGSYHGALVKPSHPPDMVDRHQSHAPGSPSKH